jgi:7,8-dihydroneopterin aldolase/epimerase/oxygenase
MSDHILITRLSVFAYHGVFPEEERLGQRFLISIDCTLDLKKAGETDDYTASVDYAHLVKSVHSLATSRRFNTLEGLAEALAHDVLFRFPLVQSVDIKVEKPHAPIAYSFDTVAVHISRTREGIP